MTSPQKSQKKNFILKGPPTTTMSRGEEGNHDWPASTMMVGEETNQIPSPLIASPLRSVCENYHQITSATSTTAAGEEGNPIWPVTNLDPSIEVPELVIWGCQDDGGIGSFSPKENSNNSRKAIDNDIRVFRDYRKKSIF